MKNLKSNTLERNRIKMLDKVRAKDPQLAEKLSSFKLDWYRIQNASSENEVDLYIYDEIMPAYMAEWFGGVSAEGLIAELNDISAKTINVRINSPGGSVFEAIAIYNALMSHASTIKVYVDALAASAASIIAMSGDTVTMMVGSQMMIHDAMGLEMGNAAELREFATFLDRQSDNIASIYAEKAGGEPADWRAKMIAETWMFADEAVELGLADAVYKRSDAALPPDTEDPEEEKKKEDTEETEEETNSVENLMNRRHPITAKGFKFAGRNRAPAPIQAKNIDDMVAVLSNFLGGK